MGELAIQEPEQVIRDTIMEEIPQKVPPVFTQEELFYRQAVQLDTEWKIDYYLGLQLEVADYQPRSRTEQRICKQYLAAMIWSGAGWREFLEAIRAQKPAPSPATKPSTLSDVQSSLKKTSWSGLTGSSWEVQQMRQLIIIDIAAKEITCNKPLRERQKPCTRPKENLHLETCAKRGKEIRTQRKFA